MKFQRLAIPDLILIEPDVYQDHRGYFMETFRADLLGEFLGFQPAFCQGNQSKSHRGVLRGLHYQSAPFAQNKLVRVISGCIIDVAVDIRPNSSTFGQYVAIGLDATSQKQIFIPAGFAHGFLALEDNTICAYKVDAYYSAECSRGLAFDDPDIGINWHQYLPDDCHLILSHQDQNQPHLREITI